MNFAEWSAQSDAERQSDQQRWYVLEPGYWHAIAIEAAAHFAAEFSSTRHVTQVFKSLYKGRELIIAVQTDLKPPKQVALPKSYLGFQVMQFPRQVPEGVLVEPGPPSSSSLTKRSQPPRARRRARAVAKSGHQIVVLEGEIDLHRLPDIEAELSVAIKEKPQKLVLDLSKVSYIDSSGLAVLINEMRKVGAYGGMLYLVGMQESVRTIFEVSRLDQAFRIFPDVAGALAAGKIDPSAHRTST
ncbi:MAG: STAS domain-containing protein [Verrucomicrobiota bacterium]